MEVLVVLLFNSLIFGTLSYRLYLGDTVEEFEKMYRLHGKIKMKDGVLQFKSFLFGAMAAKYAFGIVLFSSAVIYKLIMKERFIFRKSLPEDFWTKYFSEDEQS